MSSLTSKFLKYRAAPKAKLVAPPERKVYDVVGFISKTETVLERMGRLTEARARGEWLSSDNYFFFCNHRSFFGGRIMRQSAKIVDRNQLVQERCETGRLLAHTRGVYGGGYGA